VETKEETKVGGYVVVSLIRMDVALSGSRGFLSEVITSSEREGGLQVVLGSHQGGKNDSRYDLVANEWRSVNPLFGLTMT
jgi:hypothetical protein